MEGLICKNCGANSLERKDGYWICPYCDSRFAISREGSCIGVSVRGNHQPALSHNNVNSSIALEDDIQRLLKKCKTDPKNARKYASLILDIDPDNVEVYKYI